MATYFVRPVNGSDANAGTSFAAAFKTTQKALDAAVAGDTIKLCAEATETPDATIDVDTNAGSTSSPVHVLACNASGVEDGSTYTISGSALAANTNLLRFNLATSMKWRRVRLTAGKKYNVAFDTNTTSSIYFEKCRIDNAVASGVAIDVGSPATAAHFYDCELDHNGGSGIAFIVTNRGDWRLVGCKIHHNSGVGISHRASIIALGNWIYRNGGAGISCGSGSALQRIEGNTIYLNGSHGMAGNVFSDCNVLRNVMVGNNGHGINVTTQTAAHFLAGFQSNHFHNNSSGETNFTDGTPGFDNTSGDPLFANTADGSEDFTPLAGSPLIRAARNFGNMGASVQASGGSGSSASLDAIECGV
jgi:hypothetical protein